MYLCIFKHSNMIIVLYAKKQLKEMICCIAIARQPATHNQSVSQSVRAKSNGNVAASTNNKTLGGTKGTNYNQSI